MSEVIRAKERKNQREKEEEGEGESCKNNSEKYENMGYIQHIPMRAAV